eukprot:2166243-Pyramimonas_sp.AAC.2
MKKRERKGELCAPLLIRETEDCRDLVNILEPNPIFILDSIFLKTYSSNDSNKRAKKVDECVHTPCASSAFRKCLPVLAHSPPRPRSAPPP